jgi:hypothetical protein
MRNMIAALQRQQQAEHASATVSKSGRRRETRRIEKGPAASTTAARNMLIMHAFK